MNAEYSRPMRMRKPDLVRQGSTCSLADANRRRRPLADAVDGEDGGPVKRRAEEGAGRVRQVMRHEQNPIGVDAERLADAVLHPELVEQPRGHRLAEDARRAWRRGERRTEDALELHERLLEEHDVVELRRSDAPGASGRSRMARCGKAEVVLDAREPLLFGGGDQHPVADQRCRRVVKIAGDAKDVHQNCRRADVRSSPLSLRARQPPESSGARPAPNIRPTAATGTTTRTYQEEQKHVRLHDRRAVSQSLPALPDRLPGSQATRL